MTVPAPGGGSIALSAGHVPFQNPSWADVRAHLIHSSAWSSHAEARLTRPRYSLAGRRHRLDRPGRAYLAPGGVVGGGPGRPDRRRPYDASGRRLGRLTTIASWLLRALTTTA